MNLGPGQCETTVNFQIYASANGNPTTPLVYQIDGTGYQSGDVFPIGMTTLSFVAADTAAPMFPFPADTCTFIVNVVEYVPNSPVIITDDNLYISIPSTCEMFLLPSMVLEGNYGCYDDFVVNVENTGSNYIGQYYVGETISYTITNIETGMTGWGDATIEDKSGPYIQGCDTARVSCLADVRPVSEGGVIPDPTFTDCNAFTYNHVDMETQGTCQDTFTSIIMRIWTAADELGNVSSCNQIIVIDRTSLDEIDPECPEYTTVQCSIGVIPDFSPEVTGYPTAEIDGQTYDITDGANSICNITSSYSDMIINGCGATFKIVRTWTIMDWCLPLDFVINPWRCTQVIEYMDTTPPAVTAPANMTANANLPGCRARPVIPAVSPTDCSSYTVFISTPVGPIAGNGGQVPAPGLPIGNHTINIKVTDACGNQTSVSFTITVSDLTQPTPVCDAHTVVALDNTGYAFANATSFDDGSSDNCCIDHFDVRRATDNCGIPENLTFRNYIEFCCADVGQTIPVVMRVWDCNGNSNTCNVEVVVQDINGPSISCPPNVTLYCGDNYSDPNVTGEVVTDQAMQGAFDGLAQDNCGAAINVTSSDAGQISCGSGTIYRTYLVTDPAGASNFCVQTITVQNNNPFTGANIVFPPDITLTSCNSITNPSVTGIPTFPAPNGCRQLVYGQDPDLNLTANNACLKIQRRWYVIDWCQYNPNNPNTPGIWTGVQIITVMDQEGPTFGVCDNLTFCNFKDDCSDLAPDLTVSATDVCTDDNLLTYTWTVDLYNDGLPDPGYVVSGSGQNTMNNYPTGTHQVSYTAHDGCGNTGNCSFLFTIDDCKNPTALCKAGIIVELMQTGMIPVNVLQLEEGTSSDNCTARANLRFSFTQNTADTDLIFDCNDIGQTAVSVWVTDEAGNQDFCNTFVVVQDNMNACGGNPLVTMSGAISDEENGAVENVIVELNGDMSGTVQTDDQGVFNFANVPLGQDYTVTPQLDSDPLNGVTTYDLFLLQRHILGIEMLDSPYKIIAADANKSGSVTTFDVVEIRKVILYVDLTFPNNTSWRFVDNNYTFPDPANPFYETFPEVSNINNFATNSQTPNFVAVKIGDLNNTATGSFNASVDDRNGESKLVFKTEERVVKTGEQFTVHIGADLAEMLAFQFTLGFDAEKLDFESITPGADMTEGNFGTAHLEEGLLTTSWFRVMNVEGDKEAPLFSLTFTAKEGGQLSSMISLNSRLTKAEGYEANGIAHPVNLAFNGKDGMAGTGTFELFQNVPNPFNNATIIGFQLPEAANATLTVYDISGKVLKNINGDFAQGYHEINIDNLVLPGSGIFYYRLETPTHTATKKMIRM